MSTLFSIDELRGSSERLGMKDIVDRAYLKEFIYYSALLKIANSIRKFASIFILTLAIPIVPYYVITRIISGSLGFSDLLPLMIIGMASLLAPVMLTVYQKSGRIPMPQKKSLITGVLMIWASLLIPLLLFISIIRYLLSGAENSGVMFGIIGLIILVGGIYAFSKSIGLHEEYTKKLARRLIDRSFHDAQVVSTGEIYAYSIVIVLMCIAEILVELSLGIFNTLLLVTKLLSIIGLAVYYIMTKVIEGESRKLYERAASERLIHVRANVDPRLDVDITSFGAIYAPSKAPLILLIVPVSAVVVLLFGLSISTVFVLIAVVAFIGSSYYLVIYLVLKKHRKREFIYRIRFLPRIIYAGLNRSESTFVEKFIEYLTMVLILPVLINMAIPMLIVSAINTIRCLAASSAEIMIIIPYATFLALSLAILIYLKNRFSFSGEVKRVDYYLRYLQEDGEEVVEEYSVYKYPEFLKVYLGTLKRMPSIESRKLPHDVVVDSAAISRKKAEGFSFDHIHNSYAEKFNKVIFPVILLLSALLSVALVAISIHIVYTWMFVESVPLQVISAIIFYIPIIAVLYGVSGARQQILRMNVEEEMARLNRVFANLLYGAIFCLPLVLIVAPVLGSYGTIVFELILITILIMVVLVDIYSSSKRLYEGFSLTKHRTELKLASVNWGRMIVLFVCILSLFNAYFLALLLLYEYFSTIIVVIATIISAILLYYLLSEETDEYKILGVRILGNRLGISTFASIVLKCTFGISIVLLIIFVVKPFYPITSILFLIIMGSAWVAFFAIYVVIHNILTIWLSVERIQRFTLSNKGYIYNEPPASESISTRIEYGEMRRKALLPLLGAYIALRIVWCIPIIFALMFLRQIYYYVSSLVIVFLMLAFLFVIAIPEIIVGVLAWKMTGKEKAGLTIAIVLSIISVITFIVSSEIYDIILYMPLIGRSLWRAELALQSMTSAGGCIIVHCVLMLIIGSVIIIVFPSQVKETEKPITKREIVRGITGVPGFKVLMKVYTRRVRTVEYFELIVLLAVLAGVVLGIAMRSILTAITAPIILLTIMYMLRKTIPEIFIKMTGEDHYEYRSVGKHLQEWPTMQKNWVFGHHIARFSLLCGQGFTDLYLKLAFSLVTTILLLIGLIVYIVVIQSIIIILLGGIYTTFVGAMYIKRSINCFLRDVVYPDAFLDIRPLLREIFISKKYIQEDELKGITSVITQLTRRDLK